MLLKIKHKWPIWYIFLDITFFSLINIALFQSKSPFQKLLFPGKIKFHFALFSIVLEKRQKGHKLVTRWIKWNVTRRWKMIPKLELSCVSSRDWNAGINVYVSKDNISKAIKLIFLCLLVIRNFWNRLHIFDHDFVLVN